MIDFMLISAPRCGTTWAANWLTTDTTLCLHDPMWTHHYSELDNIKSSKVLGLAETGLYLFPEFVNKHPARKIILHRNLEEINKSLEDIGLFPISNEQNESLYRLNGAHYSWYDLWEKPKEIYEFLLHMPFDQERFELLKEIEMQPNFEGLKINKNVTAKLMKELSGII